MINFIRKSIKARLISLFLLVSLIPIAIVGYISYSSGKMALKRAILASLTTIAKSREKAIYLYLRAKLGRVIDFASDGFIRDSILVINTLGVSAADKRTVVEDLNIHLAQNNMPLDKSLYGINIIDINGRVVASTFEKEIGLDESQKVYFLETKGLDYGNAYVSDVFYSDHFGVETTVFTASAPLTDRNSGEKLGVIVNFYKTTTLNEITTNREGLAETGEVYVVNKERHIITESRFIKDAVLKLRVDTEPVILFQEQKKTMTGIYPNYRGMLVIGSSMGNEIEDEFGLGWTVLAEIDEAEAFAPIRDLGLFVIWVAVPVIFIVTFVAYLVARGVANPIKRISEQIVRVGDGDLTVNISSDSRLDEIEILSITFQKIVAGLKGITRQIKEGADVLASSATQMLTLTSQLAASATETAASVNETTTTAEEVKQTANLSSQKARHVSEIVQKTAQISQNGKKSIEETINEMNHIREQMESIAESIVRLSEQSQDIAEIVATVDSLAEQSNLLAVNASIEAAKAGEYGRGFSVVAQEVRSLAEQSKQATTQVKKILNDIQKATSAAVMATEQGSKAVERGVKQSIETGMSITAITNSISEAAQVGIQIAASSQQQLAGMTQIALAIENIKNASNQGAEGAKQLELASRDLDELSHKLKIITEQYKI